MHRRLQFDMREDPASDRRHDSRKGTCSFSGGNVRDEESRTSLSLSTGENHVQPDAGGRPYAASPRAATGEREHDRLLTIQQVAVMLHVPVSWVYGRTRTRSYATTAWHSSWKILAVSEEEIHGWIESQRGGDCAL